MTSSPVTVRDVKYLQGVAMVSVGALCLSTSGIVLRHMEAADGWQILFYRSLAYVATVLAFLTIRHGSGVGRSFMRIGRGGLLIVVTLGLGFIGYVFALLMTSVANAMFVISTAPFFAALLAWIVLGERVTPATRLAIVAAMAGVGIMFAGGYAGGRLLGSLVALVPPITFAVMVVVIRRSPAVDMIPAICLAGLVSAAISALMVERFAIPVDDLLRCLYLGTFQAGAGFILVSLGARYVPAAGVALFNLTEVVLNPIWVWIGVNEVPELWTLVGGSVVLASVAAHAGAGVRRQGRSDGGGGTPTVRPRR